MTPINLSVVNGFSEFDLDFYYPDYIPEYAQTACLSEAKKAPWTNRVPEHECWPRVLKGDTDPPPNAMNDEYKRNVHHIDQYDNVTSPEGLQPIGRVEGDEEIARNRFWRR